MQRNTKLEAAIHPNLLQHPITRHFNCLIQPCSKIAYANDFHLITYLGVPSACECDGNDSQECEDSNEHA